MIYYNQPLFTELLGHLSQLVHTSITYYDVNFRSTCMMSPGNNPLCSAIKQNWRDRCLKSDTTALQNILNSSDSCFYYSCHFGLIEIAIKLVSQNKLLGYIILGPFRDSEKDLKNRENIEHYCSCYNTDKKKILQHYHKLPKFTTEKYEAIKILIFSMLDYVTARNILAIKNDYFHSVVAPYIQEHLQENLSVENLCHAFFVGKKQLYSIFNNSINLSPQKYVTQQRIQQAKKLLTTTDLPLAMIADKVGFTDYNYFIKVFKALDNGNSPKYYRQKK